MTTVFKYMFTLSDLDQHGAVVLEIPRGAELLHAACQDEGDPGLISVWARVETTQPKAQRKIVATGTGVIVPTTAPDGPEITGRHVASIVTFNGQLVWHIFDGGEVG